MRIVLYKKSWAMKPNQIINVVSFLACKLLLFMWFGGGRGEGCFCCYDYSLYYSICSIEVRRQTKKGQYPNYFSTIKIYK